MTPASDHELIIVGGGPAGVATALFLLAAAPHLRERIVIIEKGRYPREKICAGAIGGRAERALSSIGVQVDVPSVPVFGLSVVSPAGRLVARKKDSIGRVVRRREFDAALAAVAKERGIALLEGRTVTGLEPDAQGVTVHLEGKASLRARLVVGADGVGSRVRRGLGLGHGDLVAQAVEVDTDGARGDVDQDLLHFDLTDPSLRGYGWDFPTLVDGKKLVCRGVYELLPERGGSKPPVARAGPDVSERLASYLEGRGLPAEKARFKRFAERGLQLHEPTAVPGVLLVGEAAGIDPILGEGIAQAILYGQTAGPYLARCLTDHAYGLADWTRVFAASRVGLDLTLRTRLAPWVYDRGRRVAERLVVRSEAFAQAGLHYFAGDHVPRRALLRAALTLARELLGGLD